MFESNSILIGKIERAESISGWDKIYILSKKLDIEINNLFSLKSKIELLNIISESRELENKLTKEKNKYNNTFEETVKKLFK